jgi:hypothetical protein
MQQTTSRLLPLAFVLTGTLFGTTSYACERCGVSCVHDVLDRFETGGGHEPAAFRTGGGGQGWTSSSGGSSPFGEQAILTWSVVADGTSLPTGVGEPVAPSSLIAFLDGIHHGGPGPGGTDLTQRAWFSLMDSAFERWDELSAIRFSYESHDDGVSLGGLSGITGVRGDHRLGGHHIDGTTSPTVVAYNFFPNNSDMVIDTDEVGRLGNPSGNFLRFRNTLMHEIGHGLGLNHLSSTGNNFLMEAILDVTIDGPQFDDILGIHRLYGDRFEEFSGNDISINATNLGTLSLGQKVKLGEDAVDAVVTPSENDFISINMSADTDYYRFMAGGSGRLSILLTPMGPTYQEGPQGGTQSPLNASALNNLSLFLYDSTGVNLLASSAVNGLGVAESILDFSVAAAGNFFVRISGSQDVAQFYQLDIALVPEPTGMMLILFAASLAFGVRRRN